MTPARPRRWVHAASLCVWIAFLIVPAEGWGFFHGRPLGLLSIAALAAACWVTFTRSAPLPWRVVAIALVLKAGIGTTAIVPRGFAARYYANANFTGPAERSIEPADTAFTRTDSRLRFGVDNEPDVPLEFLNDLRYNFYRETEPDRNALPFSVTWQGFWRVTSAEPQRIYVVSPGGAAQLSVGDTFFARVEANQRWTGMVTLSPGFHRVAITWAVPQGGARQFDAGRIVNQHDEPFDAAVITRRRVGTLGQIADAIVRTASQALDGCLIAWLLLQLAGGIGRAYGRLRAAFDPHEALAIAWALGIGDALVAAVPAVGRMITLSGGNDWLTYESEARDIALNGLWMREGAALGHGQPFYTQPLYPYFLAACHWLFGDGLSGIYFVQRLGAAATVILAWRTVALLVDEPAGLATLVTAMVVVYEKFAPWTGVLLTETLFVPLVWLWMYTLIQFAVAPSRRRAIAAGLVGGLATLTRSSLVMGWAGVVPALALALGWHRKRLGMLALLVTIAIGVTSMATLRNWVVAHRLVAISTEGAVVLFLGNPSPPIETPPAHKAQYERMGLDPFVQTVAEYARQQPRLFTRGLWRKAQYTLGWFGAMRPEAGTSTFYVATWISALVGAGLLPWLRPSRPRALVLVPLIVAASHFAAVVVFQPHVYGDRLLMPLYMLLVPYAALGIIAAVRATPALARGHVATACWIVLFLVTAGRLLGGFAGVDLDVFSAAVLVAGVCLAGPPGLSRGRVTLYAAYAVVLAAWLVGAPAALRGPACRAEALFLAIALFSEALLANRTAQRLAGWMLVGSVAIAAALASYGADVQSLGGLPTSLPPLFADVAVCAAAGGLCAAAVALVLPSRAVRTRRALAFAAGAALTIGALHEIGTTPHADRALLAGRIAAFGIVGAAAYTLVWLESARPIGCTPVARALEGVVFGALAASLFGVEFTDGGAALLVAGGLAAGAVHAHRAVERERLWNHPGATAPLSRS